MSTAMEMANQAVALEVITSVLEPQPSDASDLVAAKNKLRTTVLEHATLLKQIEVDKLRFKQTSGIIKLEAMLESQVDALRLQGSIQRTELAII
jgi:hypothetical protein